MVFTMQMESPDAVRVVGVSGFANGNGPVIDRTAEAIGFLSSLGRKENLAAAMRECNGGGALISSDVNVVKAPTAVAGKITDNTHNL